MSDDPKSSDQPSVPEPEAAKPVSGDKVPGDRPKAAAPAMPQSSVPEPETPKPVPGDGVPAEDKPKVAAPAESKPGATAEEAAPQDAGEGTSVALVIDDEPANRDFLMRLLEQASLDVKGASTAAEALKIAEDVESICLLVVDNKLPDMDGVELMIKLRARYPKARIVMATMLDERTLMAKAFENGCDVFMVKPHGFMELLRRLQESAGGKKDKLDRLIIDQYGPRPFRG